MGTPEVKKMRCHYEVMDLPRDCDAEAIKNEWVVDEDDEPDNFLFVPNLTLD